MSKRIKIWICVLFPRNHQRVNVNKTQMQLKSNKDFKMNLKNSKRISTNIFYVISCIT